MLDQLAKEASLADELFKKKDQRKNKYQTTRLSKSDLNPGSCAANDYQESQKLGESHQSFSSQFKDSSP